MAFPTAVNDQITDAVDEPQTRTKEDEGAENVNDQATEEGEPEENA